MVLKHGSLLREKKNKISAVLLDIMMLVMNGYQFLCKIQEEDMENLPIIVTTGASDNMA